MSAVSVYRNKRAALRDTISLQNFDPITPKFLGQPFILLGTSAYDKKNRLSKYPGYSLVNKRAAGQMILFPALVSLQRLFSLLGCRPASAPAGCCGSGTPSSWVQEGSSQDKTGGDPASSFSHFRSDPGAVPGSVHSGRRTQGNMHGTGAGRYMLIPASTSAWAWQALYIILPWLSMTGLGALMVPDV